jgi:hypothetical protein
VFGLALAVDALAVGLAHGLAGSPAVDLVLAVGAQPGGALAVGTQLGGARPAVARPSARSRRDWRSLVPLDARRATGCSGGAVESDLAMPWQGVHLTSVCLRIVARALPDNWPISDGSD